MNRPYEKFSRPAAAFAVAALAAAAAPAFAGFATVDFEDQAATVDSGSLKSTLSYPSVGGNPGIDISGTGSPGTFGVSDLSPASGTGAFGARSLAPTGGTGNFVFNFDRGVKEFSLMAGDFSGDTDTVKLIAYAGANGTGAILGTATITLPPVGDAFTFGTAELKLPNAFRSAVAFGGEGAGDNSVFFDNLAASTGSGAAAVPLPPAFLAALPVMAVAGYAHRRRRSAAIA